MMFLTAVLHQGGWAGAISGLLEGTGIPWPGAVVLAATGAQAGAAVAALITGTLFALTYTAGAAMQYWIGRSCRNLLDRFLAPETRHKLERLIKRYGQSAVLWTRPLAIGNYVSLPAGIMRMPVGKFVLYTFTGIWPWAVGMTMAGSFVSAQVKIVADALPYLAAALAVAALVSGVSTYRKNARASRNPASFGD